MVHASKKFVQKNCYNSLNIKYLTLKICRHLHPPICGGMLVTFLKKKNIHNILTLKYYWVLNVQHFNF